MTVSACVWDAAPANFTLSIDDIHIWCASLDLPNLQVDRLTQTLSADEIIRASKFHFEEHKKRFLVRRGVLRIILSYYLDIHPKELQFDYGSCGKPALKESCGGGRLRFNLSDSNSMALYAVTIERDLGVDIEHIRPMTEADQLVKRFFSQREYAAFSQLDFPQQQAAFFTCWTRKEAYIKAIGQGLSLPLNQFDISISPQEPAKLLSIKGDFQLAQRWLLQDLNPALGYAAALAVEGSGFNINCWRWVE